MNALTLDGGGGGDGTLVLESPFTILNKNKTILRTLRTRKSCKKVKRMQLESKKCLLL